MILISRSTTDLSTLVWSFEARKFEYEPVWYQVRSIEQEYIDPLNTIFGQLGPLDSSPPSKTSVLYSQTRPGRVLKKFEGTVLSMSWTSESPLTEVYILNTCQDSTVRWFFGSGYLEFQPVSAWKVFDRKSCSVFTFSLISSAWNIYTDHGHSQKPILSCPLVELTPI